MLTSRFISVFLPRRMLTTRVSGLLLAVCFLTLLTPLSLMIDLPVARFSLASNIPGDLQRVLTWSEVFAHGLGIAILAGTVCVLDPLRRRFLPRVLAGALGAGLSADAMKLVTARLRPRFLELESSVFDTFTGWLPIVFPVEGRSPLDSQWLSFPSGHTAVAVAFAIGMARLYPQGRWLFGLFAICAALQRIQAGAHYVSDTFAGAAIGVAYILLLGECRIVGNWFDRFEQRDRDESVSVLD
jgi:membrane-associated phospholipid phosphatase